jgi:glycosyl transferase family 87
LSGEDREQEGAGRRRWLAALVAALVVGGIVADAVYRAGPNQRTDLPVYLAGSARILSGQDPLYARNSRGWPYVYPPTLAVLVAPLRPLPIRLSAGLWCLFSLGVMGLGLRRWATRELTPLAEPEEERPPPDLRRLRWELWLPLALVALPSLSALLRGQVGPILLGLGLWAWCDLRAGRDLRAGFLLALCAAIKLTPLLVIVGLGFARRWKALAGASLGLVVCLVLVPLPFLGVSGTGGALQNFGQRMILRPLRDPGGHNMTSNLTHVPQNQALTSLAGRHLEGAPKWIAFALLGLLVIAALARSAWRMDLSSYGLLWGVPLLVAPVAWHHHHVVAFFALALLAARRARRTLALFAVLTILHFAFKGLRPYGLLALGTLIALALSAFPETPAGASADEAPVAEADEPVAT